jgi:mono/diheme cytochrome c family protein
VAGLGLGILPLAGAQGVETGKEVYKKANCVGCHKWNGEGGGGYGGTALSLRETTLQPDQIALVVRCGRPGTGMPYHERNAYKGDGCYGVTGTQLGSDAPPRAATFLRPEEIEAVVDYVTSTMQGKGPSTRADCEAFWGATAKQCRMMKD